MTVLSLLFSCAAPEVVVEGDPIGLPEEIDAGSYSIRAGGPNGGIVAVLVVNSVGADQFSEDWYLSPAGASGTYTAWLRPGSANPAITTYYGYANSSVTIPPTNPAPAPNAIHWHHVVTKP